MTALWTLLAFTAAARAGDVSVEVSSLDVYVGDTFEIRIVLENLSDPDDYIIPQLPDVPGLRIFTPPATSSLSSTSFINGQLSSSKTITLSYRAMVLEAGKHTIPSFEVEADGSVFRSKPITVRATVSETGDLLYVDVKADRKVYYLGEPIDATLEIWIKPFESPQLSTRPSAREMWSIVAQDRTQWGPFGVDQEGTMRRGRRTDASSVSQEYYVYELKATVTPTETGPLHLDDVSIAANYPTRVIRERDPFSFGTRLVPADPRPIFAQVSECDIEVRELPTAGKPAFFTGAVGHYDFKVSARPTSVAVGDPITLTMQIIDRGNADPRLDGLQAPALGRVEALTRDFRVPTDPIAGVIQGRLKAFTQSVRALRADVKAIPSIPFAYFDPAGEEYVVVNSDPIPISVRGVATMGMNEVVGTKPTPTPNTRTELTEVSGGLLANYTGEALLKTTSRFRPGAALWIVVLLPPLVLVSVTVWQRRTHRMRTDTRYARQRGAIRRASGRLGEAGHTAGAERARLVSVALCDYVADRRNLPDGSLTRDEVIGHLREVRIPAQVLDELSSLLSDCEQLSYAASNSTDGAELVKRGQACLTALEREKLS